MAPSAQIDYAQFRLRKCVDKTDAKAIHSLVTELAVYEREPDGIKLEVSDYERDGFGSGVPLFYATLAESKQGDQWEAIGLVLWHFAFSSWEGKTLYVEDCKSAII